MVIEKGGSPVLLISKLAQMKISSAPPSPTMPTRRRLFSLAQCQLVEGQIIQLEIASNPFSFIPRHSSDLSEPTSDHLKTKLVLMFVSGSESAHWYAEGGVPMCVGCGSACGHILWQSFRDTAMCSSRGVAFEWAA